MCYSNLHLKIQKEEKCNTLLEALNNIIKASLDPNISLIRKITQ